MNTTGTIKHQFPASNTPNGFHSFFSFILPQQEANKLFIIKGGPGTGKSSFMKKIGAFVTEKGIDVEFFHCSSDPNSLDAIVIPSLKIAFLDGTAPHVVDPIHPGSIDTILNFGQYWNASKLRANRPAITSYTKEIKGCFERAYCYLAAAKDIYHSYQLAEAPLINTNYILEKENALLQSLFSTLKPTNTYGYTRHLFSSALTCDGFLDYLPSIIGNTKEIYFIKETLGCNSKNTMKRISDTASSLGLSITCYHSPIDPEKIEDIAIPSLDIFITTSNPFHKPKVFPTNIYDFTAALDSSETTEFKVDLDKDYKLINDLLNKGMSCIAKAKKIHDALEAFYVEAVDFSKIENLLEDIFFDLEKEIEKANK